MRQQPLPVPPGDVTFPTKDWHWEAANPAANPLQEKSVELKCIYFPTNLIWKLFVPLTILADRSWRNGNQQRKLIFFPSPVIKNHSAMLLWKFLYFSLNLLLPPKILGCRRSWPEFVLLLDIFLFCFLGTKGWEKPWNPWFLFIPVQLQVWISAPSRCPWIDLFLWPGVSNVYVVENKKRV